MSIRCYSELIQLPTFMDRYQYLRLDGVVGEETFGFDRYMNQAFYKSPEWRQVRDAVIARDLGCDLGVAGREIFRRPIIHHMNPISPKDIRDRVEMILDPEYLITTIHETHLAIHYGDENLLLPEPVVRRPNDTCPWKMVEKRDDTPPLFSGLLSLDLGFPRDRCCSAGNADCDNLHASGLTFGLSSSCA